MGEAAEFQIEDDEAAQAAVKEQQVYPIPFVVDSQPALASNKREVVTEFEEKGFEMTDERIFEFALRILVAEAEEFEDERVSDFLIRADGIAGLRFGALRQHRRLVARKRGAFVELAVDLPLVLAHGPATAQRLGLVEGESFGRAAAADQQNIVGPRQREGAGKIEQSERRSGVFSRWCFGNRRRCPGNARRCRSNPADQFARQCRANPSFLASTTPAALRSTSRR